MITIRARLSSFEPDGTTRRVACVRLTGPGVSVLATFGADTYLDGAYPADHERCLAEIAEAVWSASDSGFFAVAREYETNGAIWSEAEQIHNRKAA